MNQQRSRRFKTAKQSEVDKLAAIRKGVVLPDEAAFDSNCITPGMLLCIYLIKKGPTLWLN